MGELIRLRSPKGKVGVVDVDEVNVMKLLGKGFKRAGDVMIPAHRRAVPLSRAQTERFTPREAQAAGLPASATAPPAPPPREEPGIVKALPAIGGAVGGIAGGVGGTVAGVGVGGLPGAVGGAALGGAGGEAARQLIDRIIGVEAPATPGEAAGEIGKSAAVQGATELVGAGVAKGVGMVGRPVMQAAIKSTPEGAKTAIKFGLTRTKMGADKLMRLLGEHGQAVRRMVGIATRQGHRIDPVDLLLNGERRLVQETQILGGGAGARMPEAAMDLETYRELSSNFMANNIPLGQMSPSQVEEVATKFDAVAEPIWARIARKEKDISGVDLAKARWYRHMADAMREWLEAVTPTAINPKTGAPITLKEQNAIGKALIEIKENIIPPAREGGVLSRIAQRTAGPVAGGMIGAAMPGNKSANALYGGAAGAALTSPAAMSWLALRLNDPVIGQILRQGTRAAGYSSQADETRYAR